jgi:hypothetical protein
MQPTPAKPRIIIAHVEGSGTEGMPKISLYNKRPDRRRGVGTKLTHFLTPALLKKLEITQTKRQGGVERHRRIMAWLSAPLIGDFGTLICGI